MAECLLCFAAACVIAFVFFGGFSVGYNYAAAEEFAKGHKSAVEEMSQEQHRLADEEKNKRCEAYERGYKDGVADERLVMLETIRERAEKDDL